MPNHSQTLHYTTIPLAYSRKTIDPESGREMPGIGAHSVYRFRSSVRLDTAVLQFSPKAYQEDCSLGGNTDRISIEIFTSAKGVDEIHHEDHLQWQGRKCTIDLGRREVIAAAQVGIQYPWTRRQLAH